MLLNGIRGKSPDIPQIRAIRLKIRTERHCGFRDNARQQVAVFKKQAQEQGGWPVPPVLQVMPQTGIKILRSQLDEIVPAELLKILIQFGRRPNELNAGSASVSPFDQQLSKSSIMEPNKGSAR